MSQITVRLATEDDLPAINDIYNYYVLHSTCTYQLEPETAEERLSWFRSRTERHPVTVAVERGEVIGWASLSPHKTRAAYAHSVDSSVYIRFDHHRRGIGTLLMRNIIARARALGHHTLLAGASADQTASVALHESLGFTHVARFREVGYKFGQWLDVVYLQMML